MDEYPPPRFSDWGPSTPWALQEGLSLSVPWPPPSDTWLIAPRTSPNLSKPQQWIELRLQLGPATSRRHLTCQEDWEMSPAPALGHSGSPWWPLCSWDCPPPASCCHDFHCPVCACVCVCVCWPQLTLRVRPLLQVTPACPELPREPHAAPCPLSSSHLISKLYPRTGWTRSNSRLAGPSPSPLFPWGLLWLWNWTSLHPSLPTPAHSPVSQPSVPGRLWAARDVALGCFQRPVTLHFRILLAVISDLAIHPIAD